MGLVAKRNNDSLLFRGLMHYRCPCPSVVRLRNRRLQSGCTSSFNSVSTSHAIAPGDRTIYLKSISLAWCGDGRLSGAQPEG